MAGKKPQRPKVTCKVCGKQFKAITARHLMTAHNMTMAEYREMYESQDPPAVAAPSNGSNGTHPPAPAAPSPPQAPPADLHAQTQRQVQRGELFDNLADWLTNDSPLQGLTARVVDNFLQEDGRKLKVLLRAQVAAKMERMGSMLTALDKIEQELYDPERIENMSVGQLLQLKRLLHDEGNDFVGLIKTILDLDRPVTGAPQFNFQTLIQQRGQIVNADAFPDLPESPQRREELRQAVKGLAELVTS